MVRHHCDGCGYDWSTYPPSSVPVIHVPRHVLSGGAYCTQAAFIDDGNLLSKAEIERRVDECDLVTIVHHPGVQLGEVLSQIDGIIADFNDPVKKSGYRVTHVHRYKHQSAILLKLEKAPGGSSK
jgi:hypothetical protein